MPEKILVVEDDHSMRFALSKVLEKEGYAVVGTISAEEALEKLRISSFTLAILDIRLPGMSGLDAIPLMKELAAELEIIVITAYGTTDLAFEAIQKGAYDYFTKPFSLTEIQTVVRRGVEKSKLNSEINRLRQRLQDERVLIGESDAIKAVKALIDRIAPLDTTVLITGESGTGKELVAEMIHDQSRRAGGPLVQVNCAAIPETMLESELFGHEKGAFTGAHIQKPGKFELANKGSLVLDEVGEMPISIQGKLLRAVEQKEVDRLAGRKPLAVDVRLIASTNRDLQELIAEKKLRGDLYYRLNVAAIHLPPLRERREDVPLLAHHFLWKINLKLRTCIHFITKDAMEALLFYGWPGNVRELSNVVERAAIHCATRVLSLSDVQSAFAASPIRQCLAMALPCDSLSNTLQEIERSLIIEALRKTAGVQVQAAELLGLGAKNLWKKMKKHAIHSSAIQGGGDGKDYLPVPSGLSYPFPAS